MSGKKADLLKGTLDMLVLQALSHGSQHGYGVARWIEARTEGALQIEEGSLYPALYRMSRRGWVSSSWGSSETGRRARYYALTGEGRARLETEARSWSRLVGAIGRIVPQRTG